MTTHVQRSHNMSVESLSDALRFTSSLLVALVSHKVITAHGLERQTCGLRVYNWDVALVFFSSFASLFSCVKELSIVKQCKIKYVWAECIALSRYLLATLFHWRGFGIISSCSDYIINDKSGFGFDSSVIGGLSNAYYVWFGQGNSLQLDLTRQNLHTLAWSSHLNILNLG